MSSRKTFPPPPPTRFGTAIGQQKPAPQGPQRVAPPPTRFGPATGGPMQPKMAAPGRSGAASPPPPPTRFGGAAPPVQRKAVPIPPPRSPAPPAASWAGRPGVVQRMEMEVDYESYGESGASEDEGKKLKIRGVVKDSNVHKHYRKRKKAFREAAKKKGYSPFKSQMLKQIVDDFETGDPGANTHVLLRIGAEAILHQANTANGVKLALRKFRYKKERIKIGQDGRSLGTKVKKSLKLAKKPTNIHTEMTMLYTQVNGNAKAVTNSLLGKDVTVDKPCCKMCYQWMKVAKATVVDSTDFDNAGIVGRASFVWTNPFNGESFTKEEMEKMSAKEIQDYVAKCVT